jgi:hypothetical protein
MTILLLLLAASPVLGQDYILLQSITGSGGTTATSASYQMMNTAGQPIAGLDSSASYQQGLGFWGQYNGLQIYLSTTYSFASGWNLVSVPQLVADYRKSVLFPSATSTAFAYAGRYVTKDTLSCSAGYWLKFGPAQDIFVLGSPVLKDTINVADRWNIIGSVCKPLPVSNIVSVPAGIVSSHYFGYSGGYVIAETLKAGQGYWIKTSGGGKLVLSSSAGIGPSAKVVQKDPDPGKLNEISFSDPSKEKSKEMKFYFGTAVGENTVGYDLPPVPPGGAFDVRLGTNRYVEALNERMSDPVEIPLLIQTTAQRLPIAYDIRDKARMKYFIVEKKGGKEPSRHRLLNAGSITLDGFNEKTYSLRVEPIPSAYALYQNYPNPFNPTTTIRFDLPVKSQVTLKVYNILGQEVSVLLDNDMVDEGQRSVVWNAGQGRVSSGTYFCTMRSTGVDGKTYTSVKKMMLLK